MRYGDISLRVAQGTMTITNHKSQIVRHYPGTDRSDAFGMGREAVSIMCRLIAKTEAERILYESLLQDETERNLTIDHFFYKRVVADDTATIEPIVKVEDGYWHLQVRFLALDPIPYSVATGEALY